MIEPNNNNNVTPAEILEFLKDNMVVKEDFQSEMGALKEQMESGFARIELELEGIKRDLEELSKRTKEDADALAGDYLKLKQRVDALEAQVKQMQLSQA